MRGLKQARASVSVIYEASGGGGAGVKGALETMWLAMVHVPMGSSVADIGKNFAGFCLLFAGSFQF